jgi:hypothetical protein
MTSSSSNTYTSSYTEADVEKVTLNVKADLLMIADSSKAMTRELAEEYAHDIALAAKNGYLKKIDVTLLDCLGSELKATTYFFTTGDDATGSSRPGGVRWPESPSGSIRIVLVATSTWDNEPEKASKLPWKKNWATSTVNTSHSELTSSGNRGYSSNGFGANRNDFS